MQLALDPALTVRTDLRASNARNLCRWLLRLLCLALLSGWTAPGAYAQVTGPVPMRDVTLAAPGQVVAVKFEGNHALSSAELESVVNTKVTSWFSRTLHKIPLLSGLGSPYQTFDVTTVELDTARLNLYYKDHGYITARSTFRVTASTEDIAKYEDYEKKRLIYKGTPNPTEKDAPVLNDTVTFIIDEGPVFKINRVAFEGLESLPEEFQPELTEKVTIHSGQTWSRAAAAQEVSRLDSIMLENGYPNFKHDSIIVEFPEASTKVNVLLFFTPGHRYRYGPIRIVYDSTEEETATVSEKVIRAQLYLDSGSWYKLSEVQRSEQALYKLNTFDIVRITFDTNYIASLPESQRDSAAVPMQIFLRIRQRAELTVGVSGGTGSQGFVFGGTVGYNNRNLTHTADNFTLSLSYQPLPTTQLKRSGSIDYVLPYWGMGRIPLTMGLGASQIFQDAVSNIPAYSQQTYSFHVGSNIILSRLDNRTLLTPDLTLEYALSHTDDSATRTYLVPEQLGLIPSLDYHDDRTNDIFNPTNGYYLGMLVETGVPFSFKIPSAAYVKGVPQFRYYWDLSNKGTSVIASRIQTGVTELFYPDDPRRIPPPAHLFYGGGGSNVRGWPDRTLLVSRRSIADVTPIGGINMLIFSAEWRYAPFQYDQEFTSWQKMSSPLRVVLFYDVGNVWDETVTPFTQLAHSIGLGIRYNTMFGALRFDWGLKLYDPSGKFTHSNYPAINPNDQGAWLWSGKRTFGSDIMTFHFAIGQAF